MDDADLKRVAEAEWQLLCEKSDRTSPEEYPEMCLITFDELAEVISEHPCLSRLSAAEARVGVLEEALRISATPRHARL